MLALAVAVAWRNFVEGPGPLGLNGRARAHPGHPLRIRIRGLSSGGAIAEGVGGVNKGGGEGCGAGMGGGVGGVVRRGEELGYFSSHTCVGNLCFSFRL